MLKWSSYPHPQNGGTMYSRWWTTPAGNVTKQRSEHPITPYVYENDP